MKYEVKWYDRYNQEKGITTIEAKGVNELLHKLEIVAFDHNCGTVYFFIQNVKSEEGQYPALFGSLDSLLKHGFHDEAINDSYAIFHLDVDADNAAKNEEATKYFENEYGVKASLINKRTVKFVGSKEQLKRLFKEEDISSDSYEIHDAAINDKSPQDQIDAYIKKLHQLLPNAANIYAVSHTGVSITMPSRSAYHLAYEKLKSAGYNVEEWDDDDFELIVWSKTVTFDAAIKDDKGDVKYKRATLYQDVDGNWYIDGFGEPYKTLQEAKKGVDDWIKEGIHFGDAAINDAWDVKPGAVFKDKRSGYDGNYWFIKVLKVDNGVVYFQGMNRKQDGTFDKGELEKLPMDHFKYTLQNRYKQVNSIYDAKLDDALVEPSKELINNVKQRLDKAGFIAEFRGFTGSGRAEFYIVSKEHCFTARDYDAIVVYGAELENVSKFCEKAKSPATFNISYNPSKHAISGYFHVDKTYIKDASINDSLASDIVKEVKKIYNISVSVSSQPYQGRHIVSIEVPSNVWKTLDEQTKDKLQKYFKGIERRYAGKATFYSSYNGVNFMIKDAKPKIDAKKIAEIVGIAKMIPTKDAIANPIGNVKYDKDVQKKLYSLIRIGETAVGPGIVSNIKEDLPRYGFKIEKTNLSSNGTVLEVWWNYKGYTGYNLLKDNTLNADCFRMAEDLACAVYYKDTKSTN